jgi:hypothetical protein
MRPIFFQGRWGMFHFIVGLFLVGLVIMWMVASPAFRNFVFVVLLIIGGGIWWLINSSSKEAEKSRAERATQEYIATTAIKLADLKLESVTLKKASYGLSDFVLEGTVTNNSGFALGTIYFEVMFTDCQNGNCRVVGQTTTSSNVTVPAGQVRAFSSYALQFKNLPPVNGARTWTYKITSLRKGEAEPSTREFSFLKSPESAAPQA